MRGPTRLLLTAVSAGMYAAAFPPLGLHHCAWVALTPLLLALRGARRPTAIGLGALWGVLAAEGVGTWFIGGVAHYYDRPLAVGVLFFAGVSLLLAAPFFAMFAAVYAWTRERPARCPAIIWVPALWVALELARARFLVGNPWALLGYSQIEQTPLLQIATLTGVYGVSFLLAASATAFASLLERRKGLGQLAVVGTVVAIVFGYGNTVLRRSEPHAQTVTVSIIQGNLDVGTQWRRELYGTNLTTYLRLSQQVLQDDRADLVVWPESAITFVLEEEPAYQAAIGHLFQSADAHLIVGGPAVDMHDGTRRHRNAAYLVAPNGTVLDRYDKVHLVPFAEYFPLASIDALRRRFERVRVFTPGEQLHPFDPSPYPIGVVICFEAMYPELVSTLTRQGAELLVNLTNDGWMGRTSFARQHLQMAMLRAIENRRYLIRAGATGISAIVDPYGRITHEIPLLTQGTATGTVHLLTDTTFYSRYGDVFAYICVLASIVVLAIGLRRRPT